LVFRCCSTKRRSGKNRPFKSALYVWSPLLALSSLTKVDPIKFKNKIKSFFTELQRKCTQLTFPSISFWIQLASKFSKGQLGTSYDLIFYRIRRITEKQKLVWSIIKTTQKIFSIKYYDQQKPSLFYKTEQINLYISC